MDESPINRETKLLKPPQQKLTLALSPLNLYTETKSPKALQRNPDSPPINSDIIPVLSQFQSRIASRKQVVTSFVKRRNEAKSATWKDSTLQLEGTGFA